MHDFMKRESVRVAFPEAGDLASASEASSALAVAEADGPDTTFLLQRIQSLEGQIEELRRLNTELLRSNQELDEFAAIAAHDLKEPLRGIRHYVEFLLEDEQPAIMRGPLRVPLMLWWFSHRSVIRLTYSSVWVELTSRMAMPAAFARPGALT